MSTPNPVNRLWKLNTLSHYPMHQTSHRLAMNLDYKTKLERAKSLKLPQSFFVYGTLRDDDDSGAKWTKKWCRDISHACNAKVYGFKMYKCRKLKYPFALRTNNDNDFMIGRLITFNDKDLFYHKLFEADQIEDYDDTHPDDQENEYIRSIVDVKIMNNNQNIKDEFYEYKKAIIYHQREGVSELTECDQIPNGDWMDRYLLIPSGFRNIAKRMKTNVRSIL